MKTRKLSFKEMEEIEGGGWKSCVGFATGFLGMFGGPITGLIGMGAMLASAGACEQYLNLR